MQTTYQHLQLEERSLIQTMLEQGYKPADIALSLGRSRSTISRGLSRNIYIAPSMPRPVVVISFSRELEVETLRSHGQSLFSCESAQGHIGSVVDVSPHPLRCKVFHLC